MLEGILVFIDCGWNMSSRLWRLLQPKPRFVANMFLRKLLLLFEDMRERERERLRKWEKMKVVDEFINERIYIVYFVWSYS